MQVHFKKLSKTAKAPTYSYHGDAGMDLYSDEDVTIKAGGGYSISTGIAIEIPYSYVGLVWDKGGVAKKGLKTVAGVVDAGYRGDIAVQVVNLGKKEYKISKGDKVAQMLIQKVELPLLIEAQELSDSERGDKRWGSTGIK